MTFSANQILTAAELNDLEINSLHVVKDQDGVLTEVLVENIDQRVRLGSYYEGGVGQYAKIQSENDAGTDLALALNPEGGNVGIGTTSPGQALSVKGRISADHTGNAFPLAVNSDQSTSGIIITDAGTTSNVVLRSNGNDFQIRTNGSNRVTVDSSGNVGIGTTTPSTTLDVNGSLSKNSGSFKIPHPLPAMAETHNLVHSFVEAPQADNLYRGRVALVDGAATVDLDEAAGMTTSTFELLNRDLQCFIVNNEGWTPVRGSVSGSTLTIEAQDATCADTVDWLVIGERQDQHMYETEWTDDDGRVIVEPLKPAEPEADPEPIHDVETEATATEAP